MKSTSPLNSQGQALIVILGILVIFMISIPAVIYMVQHEGKWTVKQKRTTGAFQAAETGIDRALWRLKENDTNWATVMGGGSIAGYTGTDIYNVFSGTTNTKLMGQYKVRITSRAALGEVEILSIGKDPDSNEVRAIEVVYAITPTGSIDSALNVDGILDWKPNMGVEWGPVTSYNSITKSPPNHPRLISKGLIEGKDSDPTPPNTDGKQYWSFQDIGNPPQIDLAEYRRIAKDETIVVPGDLGIATSRFFKRSDGQYSGLITNGSQVDFTNEYTNANAVIYIEGTGGARLSNKSFTAVKALICEGDVTYKAKGISYTATIPPNAKNEYQSDLSYWNSKFEGKTTYTIPNCGFSGFMYCGGNWTTAGGNATMFGVIKIIGTMSFNTFDLYFDPAVSSNIKLVNTAGDAKQKSWREVKVPWE